MFKVFVQFIYRLIKGRKLILDKTIDDCYLMQLMTTNAIALFRGLFFLHKKVMLGKSVVLRGRRYIKFGSGVSIADHVLLDGLGKEHLSIGNRTSIGRFGHIKVSGTLCDIGIGIQIGDDVGIGEFCHIGGAGGVVIGNDTIVGSYFSVHPENHIFDNIDIPIRLQGVTRQGIKIGSGCWIGAKVTILDGVVIGNNCVVAAGSVVRGNFPDACVIGGVPARILKKIGSCNSDAD